MNHPAVMTSRQRLLAAMDHQSVDHTPLLLRFWSLGGPEDNIPFNWRDEVQRVQATLALGLDDTLLLQPPLGYTEEYHPEGLPGVSSRVERLPPGAAEGQPRLRKVFRSPAGELATTVRQTNDWPHGEDVHLFDDYNLSRLVEPLVKSQADLPRLRGLLANPAPEQVDEWRLHAAQLKAEAGRLGVVLDGGWCALGDAAMWLCGMERILYGQMDDPDFIAGLLDVLLEWELGRIDLLLAAGVDEVVHMAWYESTDFWTPRAYRRLLRPRLEQIIRRVHARGARFRYIMTKSWKPYREDFLEMGIDCLTGVDPVQDQLDLQEVKRQVGGQVCLMGGLNSAVMLDQWDEPRIRQAVQQALEIMAPGSGFILYPVDAIFNNQPWEKVLYTIQCWKEFSAAA